MSLIRALYLASIAFLSGLFGEAASISYGAFLIPSILMGAGVAIDVMLATVVKFDDKELSWKNWTLPVTITHTVFPAIGYFLFWATSSAFPVAQAILGVIGFILVGLFLYEVVCESIGKEAVFGLSEWISQKFDLSAGNAYLFLAVLAVSWDALWSGPAKAAQATAGAWSTTEVILSFAIAGLVVAIVAEVALLTTSFLRKIDFQNAFSLATFSVVGKYLELSVIGGFGVLSLWHGFSDSANLYTSITISATFLFVLFIILHRPLWKTEILEAKETVT